MKVCFVSLFAYPVFDARIASHFGGAEVRAVTFARGLATRPGYEVRFVVYDHGQLAVQRFDGVSVRKVERVPETEGSFAHRAAHNALQNVNRTGRFPWIQLKKWDNRLLWQLPVAAIYVAGRASMNRRWQRFLMEVMDSDVICAFGVNESSAIAVAACKRAGKKSILFVASDHEVTHKAYYKGSCERGPFYEIGGRCYDAIMTADEIVVQTPFQREAMRRKYGRDAHLIKNPIDIGNAAYQGEVSKRRHVLWIGRAEKVQKRPEMLVELARRCPEIPFVMIMNRVDTAVFDELVASAPLNMRIIEQVAFSRMDKYFAEARVFVSTTAFEGFPNTFVQAGKHGVPVLSLEVDPDGFINREGCGFVAGGDMDRLAAALRDFWTDDQRWAACSQSIRRYVESHHSLEGRISELEAILQNAR